MANICWYKVKVKGKKNACFAYAGSIPCADNKDITTICDDPDNYELLTIGDCKWDLDYRCKDWKGEFSVHLSDDDDLAFEEGQQDKYWNITMQDCSKIFDVEVWINSLTEGDCVNCYNHYKSGERIRDFCPNDLEIEYEIDEEFDEWFDGEVGGFIIESGEVIEYNGSDGNIVIPDEAVSIGVGAFRGIRTITSIIIPESVVTIQDEAFMDCANLEKVTILGNGLNEIDSAVFDGCRKLKSINIPASVTIVDSAFDCSSLENIFVDNNNENYASVDGVVFDKEKTMLLRYPQGRSDPSYSVPNSVTEIDDQAFYKSINLQNVNIPANVTRIMPFAFQGSLNLQSVNVDINNKNYISVDGVLFNKEKTQLISFPQGKTGSSYSIPNSVTEIGFAAFCECINLESVDIPAGVTQIYPYAFLAVSI